MTTNHTSMALKRGPFLRFWDWLFAKDVEGETRLLRGIIALALILGALFMSLPLYWMIRSSLMTRTDYYHIPVYWFPPRITFEHYIGVLTKRTSNFGRAYINTLIYAFLTVANRLLVNVPAAYAFARLRFKGRDALFMAYLATMMIPGDATAIPRFVIVRKLGFYNNWAGMVLPLSAAPFIIFLLRQFFLTIPREVEEAAFLEGCSELQTLWHITLPLAKPILAVITLWAVQGAWSDFFWPLVITRSPNMRTAAVAIAFMGRYAAQSMPSAVMAAAFMLNFPIVLLALWSQKYIVQGFARSLVIG